MIMKNYKYLLLSIPAMLLASCNGDMGTEPGTDPNPVVTLFTYAPDESTGLNADNDVSVRLATNSATNAVYYLYEPQSDVAAFLQDNSPEAYVQRVVEKGQKIDVKGAENIDFNITGLHGVYMITAVATNGIAYYSADATFTARDWSVIYPGTLDWSQDFWSGANITTLQQCDQEPDLYRIYNAFENGHHLEFEKTAYSGTDSEGEKFNVIRIYRQSSFEMITLKVDGVPTDFEFYVSDIATWQDSSSYITNTSYMSVMYENGFTIFNLAWQVLLNGKWEAFGYGMNGGGSEYPSSYFIPD